MMHSKTALSSLLDYFRFQIGESGTASFFLKMRIQARDEVHVMHGPPLEAKIAWISETLDRSESMSSNQDVAVDQGLFTRLRGIRMSLQYNELTGETGGVIRLDPLLIKRRSRGPRR